MKRVLMAVMVAGIMLMAACGAESKYDSEDAKMQAYAEELAYSIMYYWHETGVFKDDEDTDLDAFLPVEEYGDLFVSDIDKEELNNTNQVVYDNMLEGYAEIEAAINAIGNDEQWRFESRLDETVQDDGFVLLARRHTNFMDRESFTHRPNEGEPPNPIEEIADVTYNP